jgi:hypothetical protein
MARLNTHASVTPRQTRSTTVDSLYRDPSVAPRNENNARTSSYSVMSPVASMNSSDKENDEPRTRENTPRPAKGRGLRGASARMPTPDSGSAAAGNSNKRRRTGDYSLGTTEIFEDEPEDEDAEEEDDDTEELDEDATPGQAEEDDHGFSKAYNPNQDPDERRRLRANIRDNQRMVDGESSLLCELHGQH